MRPLPSLVWNLILFHLICLPMVLILYPTLRRVLGEPYRREDFWPCTVLLFLNLLTNRFFATLLNGLNMISSLLFFFIMVRFVFHRRGTDLLFCMVRIVVLLCAEEAVCMAVFYLLSLLGIDLSSMMVVSLADFYRPETLFIFSLINSLSMLIVYLIIALWQHLRRRYKPIPGFDERKGWLYLRVFLRVALLVFAGLGMLTMPFTLYGDQSLIRYLIANKEQYVLLTLCCAVLMFIVLSYLVQDLRYIIQQDRMNELRKQQEVSAEMVRSLRFFRHNMVNMLYGLDGLLLSGDREKLAAYYAEMRERCALVNNDNISALEKIPASALSALLLRHMDHALRLELPFHLYVQDGIILPRSLSDSELCQILGVLLDNALEAADKAAERRVAAKISHVDDGALEIIIKNTYAGTVAPELLTRGGTSTKEGHSGQGLASCYHIINRKKGVYLNFWVTGQYVQAQLLIER